MRSFFSRRSKSSHAVCPGESSQPPKTFDTGMKILHDGKDDRVDIVFIHGLTGHREDTWRVREAASPWPKDLLPNKMDEDQISDARILTFGYDANVAKLTSLVSESRVADHAWKLLTDLSRVREENMQASRPIIFVCHSLGGIVCEDALVISGSRSEPHLSSIWSSTRGIVFLGTPHHGSGLANWGAAMGKLAGYLKQVNDKILEVLKSDSEVLARIQDSFHNLIKMRNESRAADALPPVNITCFFEELPLLGIGKVVPRDSAVLPGYIPIPILADHMGMTKFDSTDDPGFAAVYGEICRWIKGLIGPPAAVIAATSAQAATSSTTPAQLVGEGRETLRHNGSTDIEPQDHWMKRLGRNKNFVGREGILQSIMSLLPPKADPHNCQWLVVEGLGGVGKTQIALEAACRVHDLDPDCELFWLPAVSETIIDSAFRKVARRLELKGCNEDSADIRLLVKVALSESQRRWLLIIDNADDAKLLFGDGSDDDDNSDEDGICSLIDSLPNSVNGSILFTTRSHDVAVQLDVPLKNSFTVEAMNKDEAIQMLKCHIKESQMADTKSMNVLLDFLTCLPLAVRQAAAYLSRTGMSTTRYLEHCQSSDAATIELLGKEFEVRRRYKATKNPIATTWLVSFEHVSRDNALAAYYLMFICFLAEKDIPTSLLPIQQGGELVKDEAVGLLKAYAFITEREDSGTFDTHRLVRLVTQSWSKQQGQDKTVLADVIQRLTDVFPTPQYDNREDWMKYLPHAQAALHYSEPASSQVHSDLLTRVGESLHRMGRFRESGTAHRQARDLRARLLGEDDVRTLRSMNNVTEALLSQSDWVEAEELANQTVELTQDALGEQHLETLRGMNNKAEALRNLGRYGEAQQLFQQTLDLRRDVLGTKHPDTLETMNGLALVLRQLGRYADAEAMHRQEWKLSIDASGRQHPLTLDSMHNLALALSSRGKYEEVKGLHAEAKKLYAEAKELHMEEYGLSQEVLGSNHPSTLTSMYEVGVALRHTGQYDEAEEKHRTAIKLIEKVMSTDHPDILDNLNALGNVLNSQGRYDEAHQVQKQALSGYTALRGEEHPFTLDCASDLAHVLCDLMKYDEAEQEHRRVLGLREKLLGINHPDTLDSMENLAGLFQRQNRLADAEKLRGEVLERRNKAEQEDNAGPTVELRNVVI